MASACRHRRKSLGLPITTSTIPSRWPSSPPPWRAFSRMRRTPAISQPHHPHHRRQRGRRRHRLSGAARRPENVGTARPVGHHREQARRELDARGAGADQVAAGRPHAADGLDRHAHRQPSRGGEPVLRHPARFRADLDHRVVSADPDGERGGADPLGAGPHRLRQGQSGQGQCRRLGPDLPGGAEDVRAAHRHEVPIHRLPRELGGDDRAHPRRHPDVALRHRPGHRPDQDGRVRALAVTSKERLPSYPNVPTMAEAGIGDMEVEFWQGWWRPPARRRRS